MERQKLAKLVVIGTLLLGGLALPAVSTAAGHHPASRTHRAHTVSFYARVIRSSSKGLLVRTMSGKRIFFTTRQLAGTKKHRSRTHRAHRRHSRHGRLVHGRFDTTPSGTTSSGTTSSGTPSVSINIVGLQPGETIQITETTDSSGNVTITITLPTVTSTAPQDVSGTITSVSNSALTITTSTGSMTFSVSDSDITEGFGTGDVVDVTYTTASDGSFDATDVQYVESQASGVVTAVSGNGLTITDATTQQPDTFVSSSGGEGDNSDVFGGVQVGDQVDVSYHTAGGQMVADNVVDNTAGSGGDNGGDDNGGGNSWSGGNS